MSAPEYTIMAAVCDTPDWAELFVKSMRLYASEEAEILIIDNGSLPENKAWLKEQRDVRLIELPTIELYHGGAMDFGTLEARGRFVCILDSDAHAQRSGWLTDLRTLYLSDPKTRLIGCVGPEHKPLHPPLFFFERDFIVKNKILWRYAPDGRPTNTDTAQQAYWDIIGLGYSVSRLPKGPRVYSCDTHHDEIWIDGRPSIFHAWMGSRFQEWNPRRTKSMLDGISLEDHLERKKRLFAEPAVQKIMREGER